ncbi:carbon-nitrogen hydrolase family protein [Sphingomonas sp. CL5.1]|uniref:carbon-nitrogen hydrolase family protein n=1 Tax=Sphingomonas sp. CL5.1 TaxID=2653203 RepID=UPI0015842617|nr:carbon-nitrogen hydrolase family protein [Sphingomonas sp. CL5.1]QKS00457.1 carbon-nitrogen hydrolase family protein [Sphingomonas sp. CL5.1]
MSHFAIAGLQLDLPRGDNLARIADEVRGVRRRFGWIDMVVLGELSCFGPATAHAQQLPGPAEDAFVAMARENGLWLVNGSLFERDGDAIYNTTTVIAPDGHVVARHRKVYPFYPYEQGVAGGAEATVFDVPGVGRFGLAICYDIWFPELIRTLAWRGAEVILNPVMTNTIDRDVELAIVRAAAATNQAYVVSVNVAGDLGHGRSLVAGPGGEVVHQAGSGREIVAVDLDLAHVRRCRERGWHGLGQPLKSLRDGPQIFEAYARGPAASPAWQALGPLEQPPTADALSTDRK